MGTVGQELRDEIVRKEATVIRDIGDGSYGTVTLVVNPQGELLARKTAREGKFYRDAIKREIKFFLKYQQHPSFSKHIVKFIVCDLIYQKLVRFYCSNLSFKYFIHFISN